MTEEIWKDIEGYEGLYQISNLGRVKSLKHVIVRNNGVKQTFQEKILKTYICKTTGSPMIDLWFMGKEKRYTVHRLIAQAFIPNPENKPEINHINTIRNDNRIENLEWVTRTENMNNPLTKKNLSKTRNWVINGYKHWNSKPVIQLTKNGKIINVYPNASSTGIRHIGKCCNGERNTAGGYKWVFLDNYLSDWWDENYMN